MSGTIKFIAIIVVLAIIVYISVKYIYGKSTLQDVAPDKFNLSDAKMVLSSEDTSSTILKPSSSTIMAFINVNFGERTDTIDKTYQSVIGVNGSFSLDISSTGSQLSVVTSNGSVSAVETIEVPGIPLQKWVCVTILRDGRRFDIMYDDQIIASHRCNYYPVITKSQLIVGNTTLLGKGIHVLVAPYRLTPSEVSKQRAKLSDTTGKPVGTDTAFGLPPLPFTGIRTLCIPGLPCNPVSNPPSDALKSWSTPFS